METLEVVLQRSICSGFGCRECSAQTFIWSWQGNLLLQENGVHVIGVFER